MRIETANQIWTLKDEDNIKEKITYIFQENGFGKRRVKFVTCGYSETFKEAKKHPYYHKTVLPWVENLVD